MKQFPVLLTSQDEPGFNSGRTVVHHTFLVDRGKLASPYIDKFYSTVGLNSSHGHFCAISATGHLSHTDQSWSTFTGDERVLITVIMGALLAISLIISCCVGIAGAMEGMLAKRSEEIGLLRAVGATKQQIRRMFGRESLILAVTVAPLSIVFSICAVGAFSIIAPEADAYERDS